MAINPTQRRRRRLERTVRFHSVAGNWQLGGHRHAGAAGAVKNGTIGKCRIVRANINRFARAQ